MAAQLELAELAGEIGALVQQPGDRVHHPRGGAQRLARQRDPGEVLVLARRGQPAGQVERGARLVGEHQRFAVERLDDRRAEVGGFGHVAQHRYSNRPAQRQFLTHGFSAAVPVEGTLARAAIRR